MILKRLYWWYFHQRYSIHHPLEVRYWNLTVDELEYYPWHSKVYTYVIYQNLDKAAKHHEMNCERLRQLIGKYVRQCKSKLHHKPKFYVSFWSQYEEKLIGIGFDREYTYFSINLYFYFFKIDITFYNKNA